MSDSLARSLVRYVGLVRIDDRKLSPDVIRLAQGPWSAVQLGAGFAPCRRRHELGEHLMRDPSVGCIDCRAENVVGDLLLPAEASALAVLEYGAINRRGRAGIAPRVSILASWLPVAWRWTRGLAAAPFPHQTILVARVGQVGDEWPHREAAAG